MPIPFAVPETSTVVLSVNYSNIPLRVVINAAAERI